MYTQGNYKGRVITLSNNIDALESLDVQSLPLRVPMVDFPPDFLVHFLYKHSCKS